MTAKNSLEALSVLCSYADYDILSGYGLTYDDFMNGKSIEGNSISNNAICISHEGFTIDRRFEDNKRATINEDIIIYLKAPITDVQDAITALMEQLDAVTFNLPSNVLVLVSFINAKPFKQDKNKQIFIIELSLSYGN